MFSEEQRKLRLEAEAREKGTQIYRKVVPIKGYIETEAAPSEEKGLLSSAKDAIASAVNSGIESVKELIHEVEAALEPEERSEKERQNPESPLTKVVMKKKLPVTTGISYGRVKHREPKRHAEKKSWAQRFKETVLGTLATEEETPLKEKKAEKRVFASEDLMKDYHESHIPMLGMSLLMREHHTIHQN